MSKTPAQLMAAYERGVLTRTQAAIHLMEAAADRPPEQIAAELTNHWLAILREVCEEYWPPPPGGVRIMWMGSYCGPDSAEFAERLRRETERRYLAGLHAWQAFFGTGRVEPAGGGG